jgi:hypothetical protein
MRFFPHSLRQQPESPPPAYIPPKPSSPSYMIDCVFQNTYVWLTTEEGFWFYRPRVDYDGVTGYRWNGVFWMFYGIDPRFIDAVSCYPTPTLY